MMYQSPNIQKPSLEDLNEISKSLGLKAHEIDTDVYHGAMCKLLKKYSVLEKYPEPTLAVKYPRRPGYRPAQEENKHNAWYYKTDIHGAPDGPLKGCKVVVKDSIPVAGVPMMIGSRVIEGYVPDYDATVVTRVLDAGGVIIGKAVCDDMCGSGTGYLSHPNPVINPNDPTRCPGGSSSGCAVLLKTGEADMAIGGDQGGSVRFPAAWTGVVGLKPTYGLIPYTGISSGSPAIDHCGPMARSVKDCAKLLEVLAGDDDGLDMRQRRVPSQSDVPRYSQVLTSDVTGKKIALLKEAFDCCDGDVATIVWEAALRLRDMCAVVEEVSVPMHKDGFCVGPPGYFPTSAIDNFKAYGKARSRDYSATATLQQLLGKYVSDNYGLRFYAKSQNLLRLLRWEYNKILEIYDVLVMPTVPFKAPPIGSQDMTTDVILANALSMGANTAIFNGTGHPAISINAGFSEGLPVGMMIVGRHMEDDKLLNVAYAYEQLFAATH